MGSCSSGERGIRDMPVNESLGILAQIFVCFNRSLQDLACDVLGHVPGPSFGGIEGDDPDGIVVLTREKVADDGFAIGLGGVSLDVGRAELPIVFQHQVDGDVVGTLGRRLLGLLVYRDNEFFFKSADDKLGKSQERWIRDNRERLHFPFKLVEVLRKLDHDAVAGPGSGKSGGLLNAVAASAEMPPE